MGVKRRKGDAGKADRLFSKIVRHGGKCERCGKKGVSLDTAHLVGRKYSATRTMEDNARCLCKPCHHFIDNNAAEKVRLAGGMRKYDRLWKLANEERTFGPEFWEGEARRLQVLWDGMNDD